MGQYDGQAADAFTKGLQGGYGFVDKAITSKQNRDNKQREADQMATKRASQIKATQQIEAEVAESGATPQQSEAISASTATNNAEDANKTSMAIGEVVGATTYDENAEAFENANTMIQNNPSLMQKFAMKPTDKLEQLDLSNEKDDAAYTNNLATMGVTPEEMGYDLEDPEDEQAWKDFKAELQPMLSMGKVNDNYINLENLSAATKSDSRMPSKQKKAVKDNKTKQETTVKKAQVKQLDGKLAEAQTQLRAKGIRLDLDRFKTVAQKQEALEKANTKLDGLAMSPEVTQGDAEDQAKYGQTTTAPTAKVLRNGEFVEESGKPKAGDVTQVDGVTTSTTEDGKTVTQTAGTEAGTTENVVTTPEGDTVTTTTKDQDLGTSAVAPENPAQVEAGIQQSKQSRKPMDENRMRHLYALAGMTYPIPDKGAKAKQYEFLVANGLDKKTAMSWTFEPSSKGAANRKPTSYDQYIGAFLASKDGTPTKAEWTQANADWAKKATGGVKDVRDQRDLQQLEGNFRDVANFKAKYMNNPNGATGADLGSMRSIEESNAQNSPNIKARIKKPVEEMRLRHGTINSIDSLTSDLEGTLKTATRGPIENLVQSAKKVIGGDNMTPEMEATMKKTIERDTRTGMILAEFLRATSGLTVTEEERKFLGNIMTGGNWSDEESLMTAIKAFRNQTAEQNDIAAGTLMNDAPYSATLYRQYNTYKEADSQGNNTPSGGGSGRGKPRGGGGSSKTTNSSGASLKAEDYL